MIVDTSFKRILLGSCLLTLAFSSPRSVAAPSSCSASIAAKCTGNADPTSDSCLEIRYACGKYDDLLASMQGTIFTKTETYFVGVSLLARSLLESAPSLRCQYKIQGQAALENFLYLAKNSYDTTSSFGTADDLRRVNHGVKMLERSRDTDENCLQNGLSLIELQTYAKNYTKKLATQTFIGGSAGKSDFEKDMQGRMRAVLGQLQTLITLASSAETSASLSEFEITATRNRLLTIRDQLNDRIAGLTAGETDADKTPEQRIELIGAHYTLSESSPKITQMTANLPQWTSAIEAVERKLHVALDQKTPEAFEANRMTHIRSIMRDMFDATNRIDFITNFMNLESAAQGFGRITKAAQTIPTTTGSGASEQEAVFTLWRSYGGGGEAGPCTDPKNKKRWYCQSFANSRI